MFSSAVAAVLDGPPFCSRRPWTRVLGRCASCLREAARALTLVAVLAALAGPIHAQPAPEALPALPDGAWPVDQTGFVQAVLARNAASAAAQRQVDAARRLVDAERALYDPVLVARMRRDLQERPRTYDEKTDSIVPNLGKDLAVEESGTATFGLRTRLPTGATVEVSQELRRRASNLLSSGDMREYRGTLTLALRQPLLRGAGRRVTEADLRVAETEQRIEQQRFRKQLIDLTGEAAGVYWQVYRAEQTQRLRTQSLDLARQLLEEVRRRTQGGFAPRIDLLEAELAVGVRETELERAAQQLQEMRTRARNLLSVPGPALTGLRLEVVDLAAPRAASFDAGVPEQPPATMAERWPAYRTAELRLEQERIRLEFAADQERPDASVEVGASSHSLRENQLGGAVGDALRLRHPGWYAGVSLEVPLDNGAARGKRQAQALRVEAARLQLQSESVNLDNEWAIRRGQLRAALGERRQLQREVEGREALMRAERENYDLGRGRLRSLIESQDRLGESRLRLLDAEVRAELAILGLQAASGELLDLFDVRIAP